MDFYDIIAICAKNAGISVSRLGVVLGHTDNYLRNFKSMKRDTSVSNAARILDACGYALCAVPRDKMTDDMLEVAAR